MTLGRPRMLRKVSCWPAKEASGRSSAVALERTATDTLSSPPVSSRYASAISAWSCFGNSAASIQPRISFAAAGERLDVFGIHALQPRFDAAREAALREEFAEGVGGGGKSSRNPDSRLGKLGDHLAQGGVLASDLLDVGHPEPVEIHHVFEPGHEPVLRRTVEGSC